MININALMKILPISGLEPQSIASIGGFLKLPQNESWKEKITLLEPPAGQHVPFINPLAALEILLRGQGVSRESAIEQARLAIARMKMVIDEEYWIQFFDYFDSETPECLPIPEFLAWLRVEPVFPSDIAIFFDHVLEVTCCTATFEGPDNRDTPWSVKSLPPLPPPKAMIEFLPGAPWEDQDNPNIAVDLRSQKTPFMRWREEIRSTASILESALGEPVYYFSDQEDDCDDDSVHRFLVLHWCCTYKPDSSYVKYLIKISRACDLEELKFELVNPANYTQPFQMNDTFIGIEALQCQFDYLPPP